MAREIVDAHIHVFRRGCLPEKWFRIGAERWAGSKWPTPPIDSIDIEGGLVDDDVELLVPTMDAAGVSKVVCLTLDWGVHLGEPKVSIRELHEWYAELQQERFAGRFYAAAGVDPRRPDAVKIADDALGRLKLKALKLYPPTGFHVSDDMCFPLYEKCLEYDVPLVVHSAFIGYPHLGRFADPLHIGDVQVRYPDLRIVLAHSGYPFWLDEAIDITAHHPNTYLEISNWNFMLPKHTEQVGEKLLEMVSSVGAHRMIYASDHLGGRRFSGAKSQVGTWSEFVSKLPEFAAARGESVSEDEIDLIMAGNANRVFKLS